MGMLNATSTSTAILPPVHSTLFPAVPTTLHRLSSFSATGLPGQVETKLQFATGQGARGDLVGLYELETLYKTVKLTGCPATGPRRPLKGVTI